MERTERVSVARLRADAEAKAAEAADFLAGLTPEQGATVTEIGWTVAATAAHLASGSGFTAMSIKGLKRDKATRVPGFVINAANWVGARAGKRKPLTASVAKIRAGAATTLPLLDDWTDDELAVRFDKPYFGAESRAEALHYLLIGHYDEHLGQMRRAIGR